MPLGGLLEISAEKKRITKEVERLREILNGIEKKLSNESFVKKAPEQVVLKEKKKQSDFSRKLKKLQESLKSLQ